MRQSVQVPCLLAATVPEVRGLHSIAFLNGNLDGLRCRTGLISSLSSVPIHDKRWQGFVCQMASWMAKYNLWAMYSNYGVWFYQRRHIDPRAAQSPGRTEWSYVCVYITVYAFVHKTGNQEVLKIPKLYIPWYGMSILLWSALWAPSVCLRILQARERRPRALDKCWWFRQWWCDVTLAVTQLPWLVVLRLCTRCNHNM